MKKRSTWAAAASTVMLTAALTGCGGGSESPSGAAEGEVDREGTLEVAYTVPALPMDPHTTTTDVGQYSYSSLVYDRLTQIDSNGELAPMLARSWEFAADDSMTATFHLRDDATFSDGTPVDAQAVKASLDRALTDPESTAKARLSMIKSVEVVNPKTVTITTNRPAADLPYALSGTAASIVAPGALDNPDLDVKPVGSGPYVLTNLSLGESATFERRDDYWDPAVGKAGKIVLTGITDDNARLNALQSGEVDLALIKAGQTDRAESLGDGFEVFAYPAAATYALYLNTARPNLDEVKVRQALNYAVDREALNSSVLNDNCAPNVQPLTEGYAGYVADPPVPYTYDPEKAKTLLAEAGVDEGFTMTMITGAGLSPQDKIAPVLQAQLAEVGITVEIKSLDLVQMTGTWRQGGDDSYLNTRVAWPTSLMTLDTNYGPDLFPGTLPTEFSENLQNAFAPDLSDPDRTTFLESASASANEEALDVFLCALPTIVAYQDHVTGGDTMPMSAFQGILDLRDVGVTSE